MVATGDTEEGVRTLTSVARQADPSQEMLVSSLEAILENLTEAVMVADRNGRVLLRNRAAREILGPASVDPARLLTTRYFDGSLVPPDDYPIAKVLRGEKVQRQELLIEWPDGVRRILQFSGSLVDEGDRLKLAVIAYRDVTDLRRDSERKQDYLRATSHDLRNPLSTLLTQAQILDMETRRKGLIDENRAVQVILRNGLRMKAMLEDFIEFLRIDAGLWSLRPRDTDLVRLINDVVDRYRSSPDWGRISFECAGGECRAEVDAHHVERCLENLLGNACQYSPPDTLVQVSLEAGDGFARIAVKDEGSGIDPKHLPRIFDRFYRGDNSYTRGLGLGLYIVKLIAEGHGGSVSVTSEQGKGSTFTLVLPLRQDRS